MGLATIGVLSPFPLNPPSPFTRGRGNWDCRAAPCMAFWSTFISFHSTNEVQGESQLSIAEANNK